MRRIPALLCAAGLAAAPASVVAGPSNDPSSPPQSQTLGWSTSKGRLGVMLMSLTPELRKHFGASDDRGVLVAHVDPDTPAAKAGIAVGDVIVEVRGQKIDSASDVLSAVEDLGKGERVKITVFRDRASRSLDATLDASWSPPWLQNWMKPFDSHHSFSTPLEAPTWFRDVLKPLDQTRTDKDSELASSWLRKLRELFGSKSSGATCQRS